MDGAGIGSVDSPVNIVASRTEASVEQDALRQTSLKIPSITMSESPTCPTTHQSTTLAVQIMSIYSKHTQSSAPTRPQPARTEGEERTGLVPAFPHYREKLHRSCPRLPCRWHKVITCASASIGNRCLNPGFRRFSSHCRNQSEAAASSQRRGCVDPREWKDERGNDKGRRKKKTAPLSVCCSVPASCATTHPQSSCCTSSEEELARPSGGPSLTLCERRPHSGQPASPGRNYRCQAARRPGDETASSFPSRRLSMA